MATNRTLVLTSHEFTISITDRPDEYEVGLTSRSGEKTVTLNRDRDNECYRKISGIYADLAYVALLIHLDASPKREEESRANT
jgi:hypothetical protein